MVDNINGIGPQDNISAASRLRRVYGAAKPQATAQTDEVQMSAEVKELSQIQGIRLDKVLEVRRALANGTYLTPEKLDKSLDRALDEVFGKKQA